MNILMISPEIPPSYWTLRHTCRLTGAKSLVPPLGLLTVAALLPQNWKIRLADLNTIRLRRKDWNWADVVMISGMHIQKEGILHHIWEAKQSGKTVVVGGPYATLEPDKVQDAGCDFLIAGESEGTVPLLVKALSEGKKQGIFKDNHKPHMSESPVPRFDLLRFKDYACLPIQTSRGCPFECEFCDIEMLYGRKPRHKTPDQVMNELEALYRLGWRSQVFISDDNFIGDKKHARAILHELIPWMKSHGEPFDFWTQVSINLGDDLEMIDLMTEANFSNVFIGIESPDEEVLRHTRKYQNIRNPVVESLSNICKNGLSIVGSFIIGFDAEKKGAGERICALIDQTSIPMVMLNTLQAIPKTKLWNRLKREGRLLEEKTHCGLIYSTFNFVPIRPESEIMAEYARAWDYIYKPSRFLSRAYRYYTDMRPTRRTLAREKGMPCPDEIPNAQPSFKRKFWDTLGLFRLIWRQGIRSSCRVQFWKQLIAMQRINPGRTVRYLMTCATSEDMFQLRRKIFRKNVYPSPKNWPSIAVITPSTGSDSSMAACIDSLLSQDYPAHYELIFVTRDLMEPASSTIRKLIQGRPNARHVLSGKSTTCCQKNHNLLAGVKVVGDEPEILVFCDSNRVAPSNWLKEMVKPIVFGKTLVTSGYHHIMPKDCRILTLGHAISVLILSTTKRINRLNQPWGGSTAIEKAAFKDLMVEKLWVRNVVDDVSLAALLKKAKIGVTYAPEACLSTPLANETLAGWSSWLARQWLYLKFCLPGSWALAGIICYCHAALVLLAGVKCLGALLGWFQPVEALLAIIFLVLVTALGVGLRSLHPTQCPMFSWVTALYITFFMACFTHLKTILSQKIHWRGITYRVGEKGIVTEIREN